jgi:hypothetical protein
VYCRDAKEAFHKMSNSVELLAAVRRQLTCFLASSTAAAASPASPAATRPPPPSASSHGTTFSAAATERSSSERVEGEQQQKFAGGSGGADTRQLGGGGGSRSEGGGGGNVARCAARTCYGCASKLIMHALGLVEGLAQRPSCRRLILQQGLLEDLITGTKVLVLLVQTYKY